MYLRSMDKDKYAALLQVEEILRANFECFRVNVMNEDESGKYTIIYGPSEMYGHAPELEINEKAHQEKTKASL